MPKHLLICAALVAIGTASAYGQEQEAVLQKVDVPGAGFDIVVAKPKSPTGETVGYGNSSEALVIHLIGGELALPFESADTMLKALDTLQLSVCAFHVEGGGRRSTEPIALYVVPKGDAITSSQK